MLLCVTGGIACYKSANLASRLVQAGAGLSVAMTEAATRFVTPLTFQTLTGRQVFSGLWTATEDYRCGHLALNEQADLMVVAPATANIIAKMACGIADDLVSTLALSAGECPILIAPAMNTRMLKAQATQANIAALADRGVHLVGPAEGPLACGDTGPGRMAEPDQILAAAIKILKATRR
jgi:phosphopantothenoylcysteine decarboxylase/phosphopantothenate--cysteine ligase